MQQLDYPVKFSFYCENTKCHILVLFLTKSYYNPCVAYMNICSFHIHKHNTLLQLVKMFWITVCKEFRVCVTISNSKNDYFVN